MIAASNGGERALSPGLPTLSPGSLKWSRVVKKGQLKRTEDSTDTEILRAHLENKLGRDVSCERIATVNSRYASFKISAECQDAGDMYNPEHWPEGAYVRRFYEPRTAGVIGSNAGATSVLATGMNA